MERSAITAPTREEVYLTSGRWDSGDNPIDEQIEAAERIQNHVFMEEAPDYEEPTKMFNTKYATVRGFWTEEEPDKESDIPVFVLLDIESRPIRLRFPIYEDRATEDEHTETFKKFLRATGVTTENILDMVGRKLLVKHSRDDDGNEDTLVFFNHRYEALHIPVLGIVGVVGCLISFMAVLEFVGQVAPRALAGPAVIGSLCALLILLMQSIHNLIRINASNYKIE